MPRRNCNPAVDPAPLLNSVLPIRWIILLIELKELAVFEYNQYQCYIGEQLGYRPIEL
jgi:hypothetical protein